MIGIGICNFNRNEIFYHTLEQIKRYAPKGSKIVVVDDGSTTPITNADFRFKQNKGTPNAKNKCLELLEDCEHIFLFDSDCYPIKKGWEKPYIKSKEPHLNYTFKFNYEIWEGHKVCENPNGCMMYFHKSVLEKVGGFDTEFEKYGYFHGNMSCRIYNAGLTSFPFMDVLGSEKYFESLDEKKKVKSATTDQQRYLPKNKDRYLRNLESSEFKPYKTGRINIWYSNPYSTEKNIGKAYNEFCENVPDDDWICLQDGDMMYLTPDWGLQIEQAIKLHGDNFDLIGCVTNRLGRRIQLVDEGDYENLDVRHHYEKAVRLKEMHWAEVEDITNQRFIAGLFMLFKKSLWHKVKFEENSPYFDDTFSKEVLKKGGRLGLMKGLYVFHNYRCWSDNPRTAKEHLLK